MNREGFVKKVIGKSATQIDARSEIRRFDVFAEWNRLKARDRKKLSEGKAQGYGLAVAKIVAARKFSGYEPGQLTEWKRKAKAEDFDEPWWEHLGSKEEFEQKIIERMGKTFYIKVFQPAIRRAWKEKKRYEEIRDELRQPWNEQRKKS
jgi:hypothetical protein